MHLRIFCLSAIPCWLKVLGISDEGFWIRADFLHQVRKNKGHPICKTSSVDLYSELKAPALTISRRIIIDVKRTRAHTHLPYITILIQKQSLDVFNEENICVCKFPKKWLHCRCFLISFTHCFRVAIIRNTSERLLLIINSFWYVFRLQDKTIFIRKCEINAGYSMSKLRGLTHQRNYVQVVAKTRN